MTPAYIKHILELASQWKLREVDDLPVRVALKYTHTQMDSHTNNTHTHTHTAPNYVLLAHSSAHSLRNNDKCLKQQCECVNAFFKNTSRSAFLPLLPDKNRPKIKLNKHSIIIFLTFNSRMDLWMRRGHFSLKKNINELISSWLIPR